MCTQKIQSFHKAKTFLGSSVKAHALPLGHARSVVPAEQGTAAVFKKNISFDPWPTQVKNMPNYTDYVCNVTINYKSSNTDSLPVTQLFSPANIYEIDLDHDCMKCSLSDKFL